MGAKKIRFDGWLLDPASGDLERAGTHIRLQDQPLQLLTELIASRGDVVTREQLIARLWPTGVVDFDTGLNTAIRKLRTALGDTADTPRYIETLPRRGYRFIGSLDADPAPAPTAAPAAPPSAIPVPAAEVVSSGGPVHGPSRRAAFIRRALLVSVALTGLIGLLVVWYRPHGSDTVQPPARVTAVRVTPPAEPPVGAVTVSAPPAHSIAVLPFVNMSGDAKQDYFSDGISEELLDALSRLHDLQVAARTSSFSFRGKDVDVATIAHRLNVGAVLEGSVRREGNTVRISVQLINAATGFQIWTQTYDRTLTDILKLQTEVATSVAQQLEVKLVGDEDARIELGGTRNSQAYDAYLRGLQIYEKRSDEAVYREALAAFDQAISFDPHFAMAYARRAASLDHIYSFIDDPSARKRLNQQAREAAQHAVALAPELGDAHMDLAFTYIVGVSPDLAEAAREYDRAIALAPGSALVQRHFAFFSAMLGHFETAEAAARQAVRLDPEKGSTRLVLAEVLYAARRFDETLTVLDEAMALSPGSHQIESWVPDALIASGQIDKARMSCESPSAPLDEDDRHSCLALVYHTLGRQADAEREMEQLKAMIPGYDGLAWEVARVYAQWGDKQAAIRWLSRAEQIGSVDLYAGLRVDWALDPIRNEPQFKAMEARMKFPP